MDTRNCLLSLILVLYIVSFDNWELEARLHSWDILVSDFVLDGGQELVIFLVLTPNYFLHTSPSDSLAFCLGKHASFYRALSFAHLITLSVLLIGVCAFPARKVAFC